LAGRSAQACRSDVALRSHRALHWLAVSAAPACTDATMTNAATATHILTIIRGILPAQLPQQNSGRHDIEVR
jgi:hypothetical protein